MDNCAKCGKQLAWNEQKMVFWNKQLQKGYIKWYVIGSMQFGKRKEFPEYKGKKLCQLCAHEVFNSPFEETKEAISSNQEKKPQTGPEVITDFASLRVFLKQNGVVMSAFNCPRCSSMVDIPQTGKLLICKHCGNPIKPVEVAEKVKSLI
jgi:DNA-directed RNA polymerase subunit RPC12/RpoP